MKFVQTYSRGVLWRLEVDDFQALLGKQMFARYSIRLLHSDGCVILNYDSEGGFFYSDLQKRLRICGLDGLVAAQEHGSSQCILNTDMVLTSERKEEIRFDS